MAAALDRIDTFDWLVVTSRHGAERVADAVRGLVDPPRRRGDGDGHRAGRAVRAAGRARPQRSAGDRARRRLPRRPVVGPRRPGRSRGRHGRRRSAPARLRRRRCAPRTRPGCGCPADAELASALGADAVAFASGSAVEAWVEAIGTRTPPIVCVIGPTTESAATRSASRSAPLLPITPCKVSPACSPRCSSAIRRLVTSSSARKAT